MEIQWYPGHMTKAMRQMSEDMKLIDLVIELVDARVPIAGRNPDLERLGAGKARLLLLPLLSLHFPIMYKVPCSNTTLPSWFDKSFNPATSKTSLHAPS